MTDHTIVLHDHDKSPADLVAEAIALCERQIVYWESVSETVPPLHAAHSKNQRNSWLTHKAEFEDLIKKHEHYHDKVHDLEHETDCGLDELVTKAKRLLGVSE